MRCVDFGFGMLAVAGMSWCGGEKGKRMIFPRFEFD